MTSCLCDTYTQLEHNTQTCGNSEFKYPPKASSASELLLLLSLLEEEEEWEKSEWNRMMTTGDVVVVALLVGRVQQSEKATKETTTATVASKPLYRSHPSQAGKLRFEPLFLLPFLLTSIT